MIGSNTPFAAAHDMKGHEMASHGAIMVPPDFALAAAKQNIWRCARQQCGAVMVYHVPAGWETALLRNAAGAFLIRDEFALRDALTDSMADLLFCPLEAQLNPALIASLCHKASLDKIVVVEVAAPPKISIASKNVSPAKYE